MLATLVLVCALPSASASPAPAAAAPAATPDRGAELLAAAKPAERDLEYPQAKTILVELFSTPGVSDAALLEGHFLAGAIERVLENDTAARLHFLSVLQRQPDYPLAEDTPPKVRNFFELVREEVKAELQRNELPPQPPQPPQPPMKETSLLGPVVAGVGGVVAAVGVVTAVVGEVTFAEASRPFGEREGGRTMALAGWAGAVFGIGVGVAGAVLWATE